MRLMTGEKILKQACPNRHYVALVVGPNASYYYVATEMRTHDEPFEDEYEYDTLQEAQNVFDSEVAALSGQPNYAAQAEYDALHGTDNGYSPHDFIREY